MIRFAGAFPFVWGAGDQGFVPPAFDGPYWVDNLRVIRPRCYGMTVHVPVVEPGRRWSSDPTLMTFAWSEAD